jgi:osmotically-inducible protein OsmY
VTLSGSVKDIGHKYLAQDTVAELPGVKRVENQIELKDAPAESSDTWLYLKVKNTLAYHRSVSALKTTVILKDGFVTLKGVADSEAQRELTTEYAADVEGVKGVKNEMTVSPAPTPPLQTVAEMIDDASISAQVRGVLFTHRSTSAFETTVGTVAGVVSVGGTAKNAAEIDLVTKLVADIHGVKRVINTMVIASAAGSN